MQRFLVAALAGVVSVLAIACGGDSQKTQPTVSSTVLTTPASSIVPPNPPTPTFVTPTPSTATAVPSPAPTVVRIDPAPGDRLPNPAPIRDASVQAIPGPPVKYVLHIVAGLFGACAQQGTQEVTRDGTNIRVTVTNMIAPSITCQLPETTYELNLNLPGDFITGVSYTATVNGKVVAFTGQ